MNHEYESYHENKSHTTPDFPYNTYLCSIPLDFPEVSMHWHNETEIIVIKKGEAVVEVDLKAYDAKEGNMILILPGQLHSIHQKDSCTVEYENILFETAFLDNGRRDKCGSLLSSLFEGRLSHSTMIDHNLPYYSSAADYIEKIDALCSKKSHGYQLGVKGFLMSFIFEIINYHKDAAEISSKSRSVEKVKLILSYISENYSENISVQDAADVCFYSKSHFMKFFKSAIGESFTSYLSGYRLKIASQLLVSTSDSVLDIAGKTGFDNLSYFNRLFKARFGVTPLQYRKGKNNITAKGESLCSENL